MLRLTALLLSLLALACAGCGSDDAVEEEAGTSPWPALNEPEDAEDIDPFDPAYSMLPESRAAEERLLRRVGRRKDLRIPAKVVEGMPDGTMVRAVVARVFNELSLPDPRYRRLTPGQRALFALQQADAEILHGGLGGFLYEHGAVAPDLVAAARRVGAGEHATIFAQLERLFPGGRIPRDTARRQRAVDTLDETALAALNQRYSDTQFRRRTLLAPVLATYVRANPREFFAG